VLKNIFVAVLLLSALLVAASSVHAWEFSFENYAAEAAYGENASSGGTSIDSDWNAFYYKGTGTLSKYNHENIQGEVFYGMFLTPKENESWDMNGADVQTNDMSFWGIDTGMLLGWAFPIFSKPEDDFKTSITPLVGYEWKFERFTRQNFVIPRTITISDIVDEDYNIHSLDLGGRIDVVHGKFTVYAKPIFGIVLYNSSKNSLIDGSIKGDGGFLFNLDAGVDYEIVQNFTFGLAFKMELQDLNGSTKDNIIWPDSTLQTYGGTASIRYRF